MNIKSLFCISVVIILILCVNSKKQVEVEEKGTPVIDLSAGNIEQVASLPLSEAAKKVEIVPLELSDKSILANLRKVEVTTNDIWVTHYKEQSVYRFSRDGRFLNKVGKIGQGPGEYIRLADFFADEEQKEIYIMSTLNGVKVYDFDGNFKRTIIKKTMDDLFNMSDGKVLLYNQSFFLSQRAYVHRPISNPVDSLWSIALLDDNYEIRKLFKNPAHIGRENLIVENRAKPESWDAPNYLTELAPNFDFYEGSFTVKHADTDTIYRYEPDMETFIPAYIIHSDEKKGDYEVTNRWIKERRALNYFTIFSFYLTKEYIYLVASKGQMIYTYCYNKQSGNIQFIERKGKIMERQFPWFSISYIGLERPFILNNDLCGGEFTVDYRSNGKYWINVLYPGTEDNWADAEIIKDATVKDESLRQRYLQVLNETGEEANPVLLVATLK